jgi:hypothetical protein
MTRLRPGTPVRWLGPDPKLPRCVCAHCCPAPEAQLRVKRWYAYDHRIDTDIYLVEPLEHPHLWMLLRSELEPVTGPLGLTSDERLQFMELMLEGPEAQ